MLRCALPVALAQEPPSSPPPANLPQAQLSPPSDAASSSSSSFPSPLPEQAPVVQEAPKHLDHKGFELPEAVAKYLRQAVSSTSSDGDMPTRWATSRQMDRFHAQVDRKKMMSATVTLPGGDLLFYNLSTLPSPPGTESEILGGDAYEPSMPAALLPSRRTSSSGAAMVTNCTFAVSGLKMPLQMGLIFERFASKRGFKSPYWLYENQLVVFGTELKPGEVEGGIIAPTNHLSLSDGKMCYNAEQTLHPERFTANTCREPYLRTVNGLPLQSDWSNYVRGHRLVEGLMDDVVWSPQHALEAIGAIVKVKEANPCVFVSHGGAVITLFSESMTHQPMMVREYSTGAMLRRADRSLWERVASTSPAIRSSAPAPEEASLSMPSPLGTPAIRSPVC